MPDFRRYPELAEKVIKETMLDFGAHANPDEGMCVMELVSYIAGKPFGDRPPCVSPVIGSFLRNWNDDLGEEDRQQLKRWVLPVIGSAEGEEVEEERAWMAIEWLVREFAPAWLRLVPSLSPYAEGLAVPEVNARNIHTITPILEAARISAIVDWAGPTLTAIAAAKESAGGAALASSRYDDRGCMAASMALEAGQGAAIRVVREMRYKVGHAATRAALQPTVRQLQESAHELIGRMLDFPNPRHP